MEYYSATKKEWNHAICSDMDGPRDYHTEWGLPDRERQVSYVVTYMCNLKKKKIQMNVFIKQEQTCGCQGGMGEGWIGSLDTNYYI